MIDLFYTAEALADLERLANFLREQNPRAAEKALRVIIDAVQILTRHPYIGRRARKDVRELIISFGKAGYVAMYRVTATGVQLLALRHQREAGTPSRRRSRS